MTVTVAAKKRFITWLIKNHQLKRRESVWVLTYLKDNEKLLSNVHFVDEAHYCPRAIVMSTSETAGIPFRFYKGKIMSADAEKAFNDLKMNLDEKMYIQVNLPNAYESMEYIAVVEENEHTPKEVSSEDEQYANEIIDMFTQQFKLNDLQKRIDEAIDQNDKVKFMELTSELNGLQLS